MLYKLTVLFFSNTLLANIVFANETLVIELINQRDSMKLADQCIRSLAQLEKHFAFNTSSWTEQFYTSSFGHGRANELISDDRFLYRMLSCFKVSGDTSFSISEYPLIYCYGYSIPEGSTYDICVPSPCYNDSLEILLNWREISATSLIRENLTERTCVKSRKDYLWYQEMLPVLSLIYILISLLIVSIVTVYDVQRGTHNKSFSEQLLLAFSAKKNFAHLNAYPKNPNETITCMFGMRFITLIWVVIGHTFAWIQPYVENVNELRNNISDNFFNQWIANCLLAVDVFFVLGGTVNAYSFFRKFRKPNDRSILKTRGYWIGFYQHRIIRLWPAYFYTFLGVQFLSNVNHSYMWPPIDQGLQCRKYWWQNLFFISSLFDNQCMGWTWYISTEFIFYCLSPIFLLSLLKSTYMGVFLSIFCIMLSAVLRSAGMLLYNLPPTQIGWSTPPIFNKNFMQHFSEMYIKPQYRIGPYIIGLLLGYYLSRIDRKHANKLFFSTKFGWLSAISVGLLTIFGLYPISQGRNWPAYYLIYGAIHRTLFAVVVAWVIYACHIGTSKRINAILSWRPFIPLSSLSYSVYLSHMPVIFASFLAIPFPYHYSGNAMIILRSIICIVLSYVLGLQCALLSELPSINIEKLLLNYNVVRTTLKTEEEISLSDRKQKNCASESPKS